MAVPGYRDTASVPWRPEQPVDLAEAADFLRQVYADHPELGSLSQRLAEVRAEVDTTGTYVHTPAELTIGAKLAWRNASRCIGRLYWQSLLVRDCRHVTEPDEIFDELNEHLRLAGDRERRSIRPVITIFAPQRPGEPHARIWNEQLVRYAGYRKADGTVVGDPAYIDFAEAMTERGWTGKGEAFDVLPLVIETPQHGARMYELPESAVWEVPLVHPDLPWFTELGLRWYAVPAISNMRLSIGGVSYPMAPFNGWYLGTEIGGRNLADSDRYNLLPVVGERMGLDTSTERTLWRDRALIELNRAVLWSFDRAGARISDHHSESKHFLRHIAKEERAGRQVPADWTWIVPPVSGGQTAVFHHYYPEMDLRPNFYLDEEARVLGRTGTEAVAAPVEAVSRCPMHGGTAAGSSDAGSSAAAVDPTATTQVFERPQIPAPRLPLRPAVPPVARM